MTPLVSVVVPTLNRPKQLVNALESINNQTFQDFEILVVNDGGCDVSGFVAQFPKARYIEHARQWGCGGTKNTALRQARGKYIAYLDDDDIWYPKHLEKLLAVLQGGARFVYSDANVKYPGGSPQAWFSREPEEILIHNVAGVCNVMHEAELLAEVGFCDSRLKNHEDWDLWIRIACVTPLVHIKDITTCVDRTGVSMNSDIPLMEAGFEQVFSRHNHNRWIFLSPHLDDAVLSCGGMIYELAQSDIPVEVWTLCGGVGSGELSPEAREFHKKWGVETAEQAVSMRRREDERACCILGATWRVFDLPDVIYRNGEWNIDPFSKALAETDKDDHIVCPWGIGNHPDHLLTRQLAECAQKKLQYYIEVPYKYYNPVTIDENVYQSRVHPISSVGVLEWIQAIGAYKSQVEMLFETSAKMEDVIRKYGQAGIRLWRKR